MGIGHSGTMVILKIVDAALGLRVTERQETQGLDLSQPTARKALRMGIAGALAAVGWKSDEGRNAVNKKGSHDQRSSDY